MALGILLIMLVIGQDYPVLSGILFIFLILSILLWCGRGLSWPFYPDRPKYYWSKAEAKTKAPKSPHVRTERPKKPLFCERHPQAAKWLRVFNLVLGGISSVGLCFFCGMMLERYWLFLLFPPLICLWWVIGAYDKLTALRYASLPTVAVYVVIGGLRLADRVDALYIFGAAALLIGWILAWVAFVRPKNPAKNKKPDTTEP